MSKKKTATNTNWKDARRAVENIQRAQENSAMWMTRLRNIAKKEGASFDDIGDLEIEKLAGRVGIPYGRAESGEMTCAELEHAVWVWATNQRESRKATSSMTIEQASNQIGVTVRTVQRAIENGKIVKQRDGRFSASEVEKYIRLHRRPNRKRKAPTTAAIEKTKADIRREKQQS